MKIPKIIYSTWISHKPLPERFNKYIESWNKYLPEYEIRMITLENTPRNSFIDHFIENKKYAVAAQYARCQRIFETGGLYFDIDIEVIKSFDYMLGFEMFAGIESDGIDHYVNNAIFGAAEGHPFMMECMKYMDKIDFNRNDIEVGTGPLMFTGLMKKRGWVPSNKTSHCSDNLWEYGIDEVNNFNSVQLFSSKYFYPYFYTEQFKPECITKETYAIHHWAATWKNSVSVIILFSNLKEGFLDDAVMSALNQTVKPIEVIVMNDGDKENDFAIGCAVEKYKVKFAEIEKGSLASVKNSGIDFAKGRWILILKCDDKIPADFIENTIDKDDIVRAGSDEFNYITLFKKEVWEKVNGFNESMNESNSEQDFYQRAVKNGFTFTEVENTQFVQA